MRSVSTVDKKVVKRAEARKDSSDTLAVHKRKRRTLDQVRNEGYDNGVRCCIEALLADGNDREYIADVLRLQEIPFPSTDTPDWDGLFAFEDWDDWLPKLPF